MPVRSDRCAYHGLVRRPMCLCSRVEWIVLRRSALGLFPRAWESMELDLGTCRAEDETFSCIDIGRY